MKWIIMSGVIGLIGVGAWLAFDSTQKTPTPSTNTNATITAPSDATVETAEPTPAVEATKTINTAAVSGVDSHLRFSATIPESWEVEAVSASQAINIFDPAAPGDSNLEKSKIFVKYFVASSFLTLTTVDIKQRTELEINGRPAVTYSIEKKAGVADFPAQPSWRNKEHRVTDIRSTDAAMTTFYVFAKAPGVADAVFDDFLQAVTFAEAMSASVTYPMDDFPDRITKKRFGQFITPANSPVQPERFSGYHTAVDLETTAEEQNIDLPVFAIASGVVKIARTASGYGGVVLIEHGVGAETVTAVYGHVRLNSVTKSVGESVTAGERFAWLGTGATAETDGERKHLHFGMLKGVSTNIRGYVATEAGLSAWHDPVAWLAGHGL